MNVRAPSGIPGTSLGKMNELYNEAQDRMALLPNYYAWIVGHFHSAISGLVIDLGAGAGHQILHYLPMATSVIAVDFNKDLLDRSGSLAATGKYSAVEIDLRAEWAALRDIKADTVVALDVMEHFEDDKGFITKVSQLLHPGGKFVVKVPANQRLYSEIDRASGHYRRYEYLGLKALVEGQGFGMERLNYMNPLGALAYSVKRGSRVNFSRTFSSRSLRLMNLLIPCLRPLDCFQCLGGLSLIGVFEKLR